MTYFNIKDFNKSLEYADLAISKNSQWVKGHFRKGIALKELGKRQEAIDCFKKVLLLDSTNNSAKEEMKNLLLKKD